MLWPTFVIVFSSIVSLYPRSIDCIRLDFCDCTNPINGGPVDFSLPPYCTDFGDVERPKEVSYKLYTKIKEPITFTDHSCSQWMAQKEISTNLLFAHDTVYRKTVLQVGKDECWTNSEYPFKCDTETMVKDGKVLKFIKEPEGEGSWMTTQRYTTKNCISQEIKLWKACPDCPVQSAFGILANSSDEGYAHHNDITIVWRSPKSKEPTCDMKLFLEGKGNITHTKGHGVIVDDANQIEILTLHNNLTKLCNNATAIQVMGLQDTYVEINIGKPRSKRETNESVDRAGFLTLASNASLCLTWDSPIFTTRPCALNDRQTEIEEDIAMSRAGQSFTFRRNGLVQVANTELYMKRTGTNLLGVGPLANVADTDFEWIIYFGDEDTEIVPTTIIHSESNDCIAIIATTIKLAECDTTDILQQWIFEPLSNDRQPRFTSETGDALQAQAAFTRKQPKDTNEIRLNRQYVEFHGTLSLVTQPQLCLSMVKWTTLAVTMCKGKHADIDAYPKQHLALHSFGLLRFQRMTLCAGLPAAVECPVGRIEPTKWEYSSTTQRLKKRNTTLCLTALPSNSTVYFDTCSDSNSAQQWKFEHFSGKQPKALTNADEVTKITKRRQRRRRTVETTPTPAGKKPATPLTNEELELVLVENRQYFEGKLARQENILANELRDIYCQMMHLRKYQVLSLAQMSGLLAARALDLPIFSRIHAVGGTIVLQECTKLEANVKSKVTSCGIQPHVEIVNNNSLTVGKDGWSLHPFIDCFWPGPYITLNDDTYTFIRGDWQKVESTIHFNKLKLVGEFQEIALKAYETQHIQHGSFDSDAIEQLNVLSELTSRIQGSNTNSMSGLVLSSQEKNNIWDYTGWVEYLKYGFLFIIVVMVIVLFLWVMCVCVPWNTICERCANPYTKGRAAGPEAVPMIELRGSTHDHTDTYYIPGRGLFWKDHCPVHGPIDTSIKIN